MTIQTPTQPLALMPSPAPSPSAPAVLQDNERQRCEVWTRVMGYHRPVASFNVGKQGEFAERRHFREPGQPQR